MLIDHDGRLYAGHFIFARCARELDDDAFLQRLGHTAYTLVASDPMPAPYAVVTSHGEWMGLADDWFYTTWYSPSTVLATAELALSHDVFTCTVGDTDASFDFAYYRNAALVRRYVVTDPNFRGGSVVEDIGERLPAEAELLDSGRDQLDIILGLAESLGIRTMYNEDQVRIYELPDSTDS